MADDLYEDGGEATSAKKSEGAATALLPTDFFPETPEVGKVCKIRVTRILDDQVEAEYVKDEKKKSERESEPEMEMADAELAGLME